MADFIYRNDLIPMFLFLIAPGLIAGGLVLLTRKLSAAAFWVGLGTVFALLTALFALIQKGREVMNGPLSSALLAYMLPAALAISIGRLVRKRPVLTLFVSLISYAVAFVFTFSYGVNARWLGLPFP